MRNKGSEFIMAKKVLRWSMTIIFYVIYFLIFDYLIGKRLPISPMGNVFGLLVLILINIPLSVASTAKVFSILEKN